MNTYIKKQCSVELRISIGTIPILRTQFTFHKYYVFGKKISLNVITVSVRFEIETEVPQTKNYSHFEDPNSLNFRYANTPPR